MWHAARYNYYIIRVVDLILSQRKIKDPEFLIIRNMRGSNTPGLHVNCIHDTMCMFYTPGRLTGITERWILLSKQEKNNVNTRVYGITARVIRYFILHAVQCSAVIYLINSVTLGI